MRTQDLFLVFLLTFTRNVKCANLIVYSNEAPEVLTDRPENEIEDTTTISDKTARTPDTIITLTKQEDGKNVELSTEGKEIGKREVNENKTLGHDQDDTITTTTQQSAAEREVLAEPDEKRVSDQPTDGSKNESSNVNLAAETTQSPRNDPQEHEKGNSTSQPNGNRLVPSSTVAVETKDLTKESDKPVIKDSISKEPKKGSSPSPTSSDGRKGTKLETLNLNDHPASQIHNDPREKNKESNGISLFPNKSNARNSQARQSNHRDDIPSNDTAAEEPKNAPRQENKISSIKSLQIENLLQNTNESLSTSSKYEATTKVSTRTVPSANSTNTVPNKVFGYFSKEGFKKFVWASAGVLGVLGFVYYIITSINY